MKKTLLKNLSLGLLIALPLLASCQTTKSTDNKVAIDVYSEDESEELNSQLPETVKSANNEEDIVISDSIKSAKKKTSGLQDLFTLGNKNEIMTCDETSLFTSSISGNPTQKNAIVVLNTKDGTAGFGSQYLAAFYFVLMDDAARGKLKAAVENYLSDFENKRLQRKGRNLYKQYGSSDGKLQWGSLKTSTPNYGYGKLYYGYSFENKSPYFTISSFPVVNEYYTQAGEATSRESINVKYYFTKAQAKALIDMLSDEKIAGYLGLKKTFVPEEADEY